MNDDDAIAALADHLGAIAGAISRPLVRDGLIALLREPAAQEFTLPTIRQLHQLLGVVCNALVEEDEQRYTQFRDRQRVLMLMPVDALWRDGYECGAERAAREMAELVADYQALFRAMEQND
jgi:hypothetical protein